MLNSDSMSVSDQMVLFATFQYGYPSKYQNTDQIQRWLITFGDTVKPYMIKAEMLRMCIWVTSKINSTWEWLCFATWIH